MRIFVAVAVMILAFSCTKQEVKTGHWRAELEIQGQSLPFNMEVIQDEKGGLDVYLLNAGERLLLDEVKTEGDSLFATLHIFDASLRARINGNKMQGSFVRNYLPGDLIPFRAEHGRSDRFIRKGQPGTTDYTGKYRVIFSSGKDTTIAVGVFEQLGDSVTATFLTPTGDYRYIQGNVMNDSLYMSTFDGNHAFLFMAAKTGTDTVAGLFLSGKAGRETWIAVRDEKAALPDASSLTFLKPGYEKLDFTFRDVNGDSVSVNEERFRDKVIIVQLLGTWCPNCMDETRFLAPWYQENKDRGIEIIGLAYERKDDFAYASERVKKMIEKMRVEYPVLIAGVNDKLKAAETLPALNKVVAFPTTIFIGKNGKVAKIHTGFSGPGTGKYYQEFIEEFNQTVNELLTVKNNLP